jgi:hypothetical protein
MQWSLPKGHIEAGESAEQAAVREVAEETGIDGRIIGRLGTIDFWFMADGRRVHKTVHHCLLRAEGVELSDADVEVSAVAWVPLDELAGPWRTRTSGPPWPAPRGCSTVSDRVRRLGTALAAAAALAAGLPFAEPASAAGRPGDRHAAEPGTARRPGPTRPCRSPRCLNTSADDTARSRSAAPRHPGHPGRAAADRHHAPATGVASGRRRTWPVDCRQGSRSRCASRPRSPIWGCPSRQLGVYPMR